MTITASGQPLVRAFVQARMSSARFPGKVLAPFRGEPVIIHVVRAAAEVVGTDNVVVATSDDTSDDPLAAYLESRRIAVFRGPLLDVAERFRQCAAAYPCDWLLRLSADSPLLDPEVLRLVVAGVREGVDLVTTVAPRTFPAGQNAELLRVSTFLGLDFAALLPDEREHVTTFFYRHAGRFSIVNIESGDPGLAATSVAVDTIDDLRRLEGTV